MKKRRLFSLHQALETESANRLVQLLENFPLAVPLLGG
jgi:hypothetical protein